MSTDPTQSFSLIQTGYNILSYIEEGVQNKMEEWPVLTAVFAVTSGIFGMRNIVNAYSLTSVAVGVIFTIPSYIFFRDMLNDFPTFKERILKSFQENTVAQVALQIARKFKQEVQDLSQIGSDRFPVVIAAAFTSVFIYCITDLGIKTISMLAITALALLNVDKTKIYDKFKEIARQAVENIQDQAKYEEVSPGQPGGAPGGSPFRPSDCSTS